jgi:hypothetical protein
VATERRTEGRGDGLCGDSITQDRNPILSLVRKNFFHRTREVELMVRILEEASKKIWAAVYDKDGEGAKGRACFGKNKFSGFDTVRSERT